METPNFIYGAHAILEALNECQPIDQILIKKQSDSEQIKEIIVQAKKQNVTIKSVPIEKLNKITRKAHQGVIAFMSPVEFHDVEQIVQFVTTRIDDIQSVARKMVGIESTYKDTDDHT